MKRKSFILTALAALAVLPACRPEAEVPQPPKEGILVEIPITLEQPGEATKVDANTTTGVCTWTSGDHVAIYVSGGSGAVGYQTGTVNTSNNTVAIDIEPGQSFANYAVYPDGFQNAANYSGATPGVIYPSSYSFTGHADLSTGTYSMAPMMAVCGDDVLNFFHVGGMLRLALSNVPAEAAKLKLTFVGMSDVCGTCTVTNPGTLKATSAITSGGGNVLTVTGFTRSATMYVNVPLPCGNYSSLTAIRVKVLDGSDNQLANVSKTATGWGTLKHGYARIVPVDFNVDALGSVKLSANTPVTLWKSQTIQREAKALYGDGLPFADATVTWESSNASVATVNSSTGLVTAAGPGSAVITATATSGLDGSTVSESFTVYVNAVTGLSVTPDSYKVAPGNTIILTATLTHTNNGTNQSYPSALTVNWTSNNTSKVSVASASTTPVVVNATTMTATVSVNGVAYGSATITASVAATYATPGALSDNNNTVICEVPTTITGGNGTFRGKYIAPGFLQKSGSSYSLTGELDGLAAVMASYGTAAARNKYYFSWTTLSAFGTSGTSGSNLYISGTAYDDGENEWHIPTIGEWDTIINGTPTPNIMVGSTVLNGATNKKGFVILRVNLEGSTLDGKGLTNSDGSSVGSPISDGTSLTHTDYINGMLLIPDGASVTCQRINENKVGTATSISFSDNTITYEDLEILVAGGCVFLPAAGLYETGSYNKWYYGGSNAFYWSASEVPSDTDSAHRLRFESNHVFLNDPRGKSIHYYLVRLVR